MSNHTTRKSDRSVKQKGAAKVARIPIPVASTAQPLRKPDWIRVRMPNCGAVERLKGVLRDHQLHTVCEEATCPNIGECFSHGTATFMIMGDLCTRHCPFCGVGHGHPAPLNTEEPRQLAATVAAMGLRCVVITSVDRDDLRDGGAAHFTACISAVRRSIPGIQIETLVPDFRGRTEDAIEILGATPPDVCNHNLETAPRLYAQVRPGANYHWSLQLLKNFKARHPSIPTKSGVMLGLGETNEEMRAVMRDLRAHNCDMLTLGQYLQPALHHLAVQRYATPAEFRELARYGQAIGFANVASGPLVRSSYHADQQAVRALSE